MFIQFLLLANIWQVADDVEANEDEEWEYVEEGPPEIIWQGNEIIVKKNKVRVKKKKTNQALVRWVLSATIIVWIKMFPRLELLTLPVLDM